MGIPGILKEIGKGERVALSKLAIEHLECTNRPLRIAIDAAIWNFQHQAGQGGKNPALRTLFFRLLKLLALPINPVFVYDGKNKPLTKRGKTVSRYGTSIENEASKRLIAAFRFPHHMAPGEAEAECALLQRKGIVDAVMSQDADAIMFGSTLTLRDWSKEGTRGNKTPTHVNVLKLDSIKRDAGLDPDGMMLVAMLSGGDYNEAGVAGFGPGLACEIARAGFGSDLLDIVKKNDPIELQAWRERLNYELQTNESGYFRTKHSKLEVPQDFPDRTILGYYTTPVVSEDTELGGLESGWKAKWTSELDVVALRQYTADNFDWNWKSGCRSFLRRMAQPSFQDRLLRSTASLPFISSDCVTEARQHFTTDGTIELRLTVVPARFVGIDLEAEEDNPEYATDEAIQDVEEDEAIDAEALPESTVSSSVTRKQPWNPLAPEKWWVPQTLLQYGMPGLVEDWQQRQRDIAADPKKFAARKAVKSTKSAKNIDTSANPGSLHAFLQQAPTTKPTSRAQVNHKPRDVHTATSPRRIHNTGPVDTRVPSIAEFFKPQKARIDGNRNGAEQPKDPEPASEIAPRSHIFSVPDLDDSEDNSQSESQYGAAPVPHRSEADQACFYSDAAGLDRSLANVTQRRKRGPRPLSKIVPDSGSSETLRVNYTTTSESDLAIVDKDQIPQPETSGEYRVAADITASPSPSTVAGSQFSVASRDSLPGAWKKTKSKASDKRSRRVTYIDLTAD